jgi:nitroimidazol reductase NimA-like FMN-containing flavoprotein (pyridoxamine 5'-phosphate oxidase superfamily)
MRRADKEIKSRKEMERIIKNAKVCRVGFVDGKKPYVLPFNYGYAGGIFYIHCAKEGRKLDIIRKNNRVCVEIDSDHKLKPGKYACGHTFWYRSVLAEGSAVVLDSKAAKIRALKLIMKQMTGRAFGVFRPESLEKIRIIRIKAGKITGKKSGY